jgi:hypothetical protein
MLGMDHMLRGRCDPARDMERTLERQSETAVGLPTINAAVWVKRQDEEV